MSSHTALFARWLPNILVLFSQQHIWKSITWLDLRLFWLLSHLKYFSPNSWRYAHLQLTCHNCFSWYDDVLIPLQGNSIRWKTIWKTNFLRFPRKNAVTQEKHLQGFQWFVYMCRIRMKWAGECAVCKRDWTQNLCTSSLFSWVFLNAHSSKTSLKCVLLHHKNM